MDYQVFYNQINRLKDCYGAENYNEDRVEIFWRILQKEPDRWMLDCVDFFIGNFREYPLLPEFRARMLLNLKKPCLTNQPCAD